MLGVGTRADNVILLKHKTGSIFDGGDPLASRNERREHTLRVVVLPLRASADNYVKTPLNACLE